MRTNFLARLRFRPLVVGGLFCFGLVLAKTGFAEGALLKLQVQGIRDDSGSLRVSLYREPESFRKEERAFKLISQPARKGEVTLAFDDVPPGRYAIMAYHDENNDGKLNLRLGMFPQEGYALSNNPQVIGPPRFNDSAFDFPATDGSVLRLDLKY